MSNIGLLKLDALARRACGWHYGADELPLRSDDPISIVADQVREIEAPRFANVSCSNCGTEFGSGDSGFSHCENHAHLSGVAA